MAKGRYSLNVHEGLRERLYARIYAQDREAEEEFWDALTDLIEAADALDMASVMCKCGAPTRYAQDRYRTARAKTLGEQAP